MTFLCVLDVPSIAHQEVILSRILLIVRTSFTLSPEIIDAGLPPLRMVKMKEMTFLICPGKASICIVNPTSGNSVSIMDVLITDLSFVCL